MSYTNFTTEESAEDIERRAAEPIGDEGGPRQPGLQCTSSTIRNMTNTRAKRNTISCRRFVSNARTVTEGSVPVVSRNRVDILGPAVPTYRQHEIPWAADCVYSGDVHVVHEGQSGAGDGGKSASERVSRDIQLPGFSLLLVEAFDCVVHATFAVPYRVHAVIEALPPVRFQGKGDTVRACGVCSPR